MTLYREGWSGRDIAAEMGISKSTVYAINRKAGVELRPQHVTY